MSESAHLRSTPPPAPTGIRDDEELVQRRSLRDYYIILRERLWIALPLALIVAIGYGYWKSREVPMYSASATLQFDKPETIVTQQGIIDPSVHSKADIYTYIQLLHSGQLFNKVVNSFTPEQQKVILRPALKKLPPGQPPPSVGSMMGSLSVDEVGETFLIRISVNHPDPEAAALIANRYVDQFIDSELDKLSNTNDDGYSNLKSRVAELQQDYSNAQQQQEDFIREHKLLSVDNTVDSITDSLREVDKRLEASKLSLIANRNFLQQIADYQRQGRDLLQIEYIATQPTVAPLLAKLQALRAQQASLSERYYEKHPAMVEVQNQIVITQDLIDKAIKNVVATLQATLSSEENAQDSLAAEAKSRNAEELNMRLHRNQYDTLRLATETAKNNLSQLLDRLNQTRTAKTLEKIPIHKLDAAAPNYQPYAPNMPSIIKTCIGMGIFTFIGVAVGLSFIDDRIKSAWDIESFIGVTLLGIVPDLAALRTEEKYLMMLEGKNSPGVEPFLGIYSSLKIHSKLDFPKSILITSTIPGEGKTLISSNLAGAYARHGRRTILVDCDLRRPMLHRHFKQPNTAGVITWFEAGAVLEGRVLDNPSLGITKLGENLWVLTSGGRSKSPTGMLESPLFGQLLEKLKREFDLVVVDSPPMGAVSDALLIAERTDEIIYVCRFNRAYRKHIRLYMRTLMNAKHTVLGIVLNGLSPRRIEYYSNYRYYRSYKKYYGTQA
jgi:capsular exopolysaccharide synthesis family protein